MRILTRWSDKTTYFILIGFCLGAFLLSFVLLLLVYTEDWIFWEGVNACIIKRSMPCLLDQIGDREVLFNCIKLAITMVVSLNALMVSCLVTILYKLRLEHIKKDK